MLLSQRRILPSAILISYSDTEASSLHSQVPMTAALVDFPTKRSSSIFDKKLLILR